MKSNFLGMMPKWQAKGILFFGVCLTIVIFYGLTNHFRGVTVLKEFEGFIGK